MQEYDKVNVTIKVIDVNSPQTVGGGKNKQEVGIGDKTGTAKLTLWENDIDTLNFIPCSVIQSSVF